jgi:hypothetical protein
MQFGDGQQGFPNGLRGDPGVREGALEFGIGLRVWIDETADVVLQFRMEFLSGGSSTGLEILDAADAGAEFVESSVDGIASPAEGGLGESRGTSTVGVGHLGLEASSFVSGE